MKLTTQKLKRLIREELKKIVEMEGSTSEAEEILKQIEELVEIIPTMQGDDSYYAYGEDQDEAASRLLDLMMQYKAAGGDMSSQIIKTAGNIVNEYM